MMTPDQLIQQVLESTKSANASLAEGQQVMQAGITRAEVEHAAASGMKQQAIQQAQLSAGKIAEAEYAQNSMLLDIQSALRLDPTKAGNEIATSLAQIDNASKQYASARAEYDTAVTADFFDNPVGYILAQLKLPSLAAKVNTAADSEAIGYQNIARRTQMLDQSKQSLLANTVDIIKEAKLQASRSNALLAESELSQHEADNAIRIASAKLQAYQIADKLQGNTVQAINTISSIKNAAESSALRREAAADRKEAKAQQYQDAELRTLERQYRVELLKEQLSKKKLDSDQEASYNGILSEVSTSLGMRVPISVNAIQKMTDVNEKEKWLRVMTTGMYGTDLYSATKLYDKDGNKQALQGTSMYQTWYKLAESGTSYEKLVSTVRAKDPATAGKPLTKQQAAPLAFEMYTTDLVGSMDSTDKRARHLGDPWWDKTYNPYVAPAVALSKAIDSMPQLAQLKTNGVKKAVDVLLQSGAVSTENLTAEQFKQVLLSQALQVGERKIPAKQAASEVAQFFSAAAEYNRILNKYDLFGLPKQTSYMFELGDQRVNLMNPAQVEKLLVQTGKQAVIKSHFNDPAIGNILGNPSTLY